MTSKEENPRRPSPLRDVLRDHYRSGRDDLGETFFGAVLSSATLYRRSVGFFSSSAMASWAEALLRMASDDLEVRLIASPELQPMDLEVLRALEAPGAREGHRAKLADRVVEEIIKLLDAPGDTSRRAGVFAWLVATERLKLKFAFAEHVDDARMYHEKIGIVSLIGGDRIAFTGSANETAAGMRRNYESIDVYRDWNAAERSRVEVKEQQFDEAWSNAADGLCVLSPSPEVLSRLRARARAPSTAPRPAKPEARAEPTPSRWRHQDEAVAAFAAAGAGVLEMATGTGKTRTALRILTDLANAGDILSVVVTMDGTDLLDQWAGELERWLGDTRRRWIMYRQYERHHDLEEFLLEPTSSLLVISRTQLPRLMRGLSKSAAARMLIIHDEVHGLGTPSLVRDLAGTHDRFRYRLGLSATPDRAYDQVGNDFLEREIGPSLYRFPLEAAIQRGVLSEFDYEPLHYDLTDGDRQRLRQVYTKQASRAREGRPMSREEVWTEISRVYKTAEMKPAVFAQRLEEDASILQRSIIFVETKEYGQPILEMIDGYTHRYRTYYAEDDRAHLVAFAGGDIDCLITCHRISQGIDIQSLNSVVLFSSARARLETIQRIGRCLRADPSNPHKRARVLDFVRPAQPGDKEPNADQDRCRWLTELSKMRREEELAT
ncbi:MAG: DEAD/DEAH box helicase family protein [Sphingomonas sp.]|uniref:DEAD/DEAH box helicase family protein n=1 Tax=Sphingomonas sp. TaxID=28214 RepID=UPI0025D4642B|nr:DEAD/DEAH box helicase family protein [Sphingomonas sp.]MBY0285233.1 DEAD/DEAH box helicase family protein [Sphingomonas sp.]